MCCILARIRRKIKISVKLSSILFVYIATKLSAKCCLQTFVWHQVAWNLGTIQLPARETFRTIGFFSMKCNVTQDHKITGSPWSACLVEIQNTIITVPGSLKPFVQLNLWEVVWFSKRAPPWNRLDYCTIYMYVAGLELTWQQETWIEALTGHC